MKNCSDKKRADFLLDEIGNIDDRFLTEAFTYHSAASTTKLRKQKSNAWKYLLTAACILLVITAGFGGILSAIGHRKVPGTPIPDSSGSNAPGVPGQMQPDNSLDRLLQTCTESTAFKKTSAEEIGFFEGTVRLTVKNTATGELFISRPLTVAEQTALRRELESTSAQAFTGNTDAYRIWAVLGNGQVVSPCLTPSAGNIGIADLFDYETERVPTQIFINLLSGMI